MFGLRGVRSTLVVSASSHTMSAARPRIRAPRAARRVGQRAGEEVHAEVRAGAAGDQLLDLGVGLGRPEHRVELDLDQLRHQETEAPGQLADDHLGHERPQPLAGAPELDHVQPVVVGLDQARQRAALAQRRDVADRGDRPQGGGDRHPAEGTRSLSRGRAARRPGCRGAPRGSSGLSNRRCVSTITSARAPGRPATRSRSRRSSRTRRPRTRPGRSPTTCWRRSPAPVRRAPSGRR